MKVSLLALAAALVAFIPNSSVQFGNNGKISASQPQGSSYIVVKWSTQEEDGVKYFQVEKKSDVDNNFDPIWGATVNATGAGSSYQYMDNSVYKTASSELFQYRVSAVDYNGNIIASSDPAAVDFNFSSSLSGVAGRTWGSIKAMFR